MARGGAYLIIGLCGECALAARGRLRVSAVISSLLAGGWSIVEGARLAGFGMLMCSHYAGGVYFLIILLTFARLSFSLRASLKAWPLLWTVWAILLPGRGSFSNIISKVPGSWDGRRGFLLSGGGLKSDHCFLDVFISSPHEKL